VRCSSSGISSNSSSKSHGQYEQAQAPATLPDPERKKPAVTATMYRSPAGPTVKPQASLGDISLRVPTL
jgi:hypothetical protein